MTAAARSAATTSTSRPHDGAVVTAVALADADLPVGRAPDRVAVVITRERHGARS